MSKSQRWIITTHEDRPISDIARDLKKNGFVIDQTLEEIGSITGSATKAVASTLGAINGVADVSPDTAIDIGPPGSDRTW